jgi:probable F420-dependent oxidoreductase
MSDPRRRPLKVGLFIGLFEGFMNGQTATWTDIAAMAHKAEEVGFDSIWLPDHFLIRDDPGEEPLGVWECTTMLAALAAATARVELGTLVLCSGFRNPAMLAKMADTIDEISGGRLILGLGAGYHDPEYHAFGYPTDHRYSRFAEALQIIHGLLRNGSIDFAGTYYQARECVLRPRGPRAEGPPIMIGTRGPKMLRLTARYADLWNAFLLRGHSRPEDLAPAMDPLDVACKEVGRDPATLGRTATVHWNASERGEGIPSWVRSRYGPPLTGKPDELAEVFRAFARAGISHLQVNIWPHTLVGVEAFGPVLEALDQHT